MQCFELLFKTCFQKYYCANAFIKRSSNYIFVCEDIIPIKMREIERYMLKINLEFR